MSNSDFITTEGTEESYDENYGGTRIKGLTSQCLRLRVPSGSSELTLGVSETQFGIQASTTADVSRRGLWGAVKKMHDKPRTKVALGIDDRGFVGVLTAAHKGNIYLCATGSADIGDEYQHAQRVGTIIDTGINAARAALMLYGHTWYDVGGAKLPKWLLVAQTGYYGTLAAMSPMAGGTAQGATNIDYLKTGHVGMFGAKSVSIQSIESISSSSAVFNAQNAGISASMNSVFAASVNAGAVGSLNAGYSASITGATASTVGMFDAGVVAREGWARVEGRSVRIGNRDIKFRMSNLVSGNVEATNDVWIRSKDLIDIHVSGAEPDPGPTVGGHAGGTTSFIPTGVQITDGRIRAATGSPDGKDSAVLHMSPSTVAATTGKSALQVTDSGITITRLKTEPAVSAAKTRQSQRKLYDETFAKVWGVVNQLSSVSGKALLGVGAGALAATIGGGIYGAAMGKTNDEDGGNDGAKLGLAAGAAVGGMGAVVGLVLRAMKAAGKAQRATQVGASKVFKDAMNGIVDAEKKMMTPIPFSPVIEVTDDMIELSIGQSLIQITQKGILMEGPNIMINGTEFKM